MSSGKFMSSLRVANASAKFSLFLATLNALYLFQRKTLSSHSLEQENFCKHATTPIFWHHPHQWDMVENWKIINCKLYGEHKNLHQRASLNVFTVNVKKATKQEDAPDTNLT